LSKDDEMKSGVTVNVSRCSASHYMDLLAEESKKEQGRKKKNEDLKEQLKTK
jgi:hypothetical protein